MLFTDQILEEITHISLVAAEAAENETLKKLLEKSIENTQITAKLKKYISEHLWLTNSLAKLPT